MLLLQLQMIYSNNINKMILMSLQLKEKRRWKNNEKNKWTKNKKSNKGYKN